MMITCKVLYLLNLKEWNHLHVQFYQIIKPRKMIQIICLIIKWILNKLVNNTQSYITEYLYLPKGNFDYPSSKKHMDAVREEIIQKKLQE